MRIIAHYCSSLAQYLIAVNNLPTWCNHLGMDRGEVQMRVQNQNGVILSALRCHETWIYFPLRKYKRRELCHTKTEENRMQCMWKRKEKQDYFPSLSLDILLDVWDAFRTSMRWILIYGVSGNLFWQYMLHSASNGETLRHSYLRRVVVVVLVGVGQVHLSWCVSLASRYSQ